MKHPPKHIAVVVNYFPTVSETFIVNQINSLIDSGYLVSLYSYNQAEAKVLHASFKTHNLLDTVRYFVKPPKSKMLRLSLFFKWSIRHFKQIHWPMYFKTLNIFAYGKDAYTLKLFFEAQWFLVPYQADLIHAHFGMVGNRIAYLKAKGILPKALPLLTTFHGYDLEPKHLHTYKQRYFHLFRFADVFTVNTPYLKELLTKVNIRQKPCYVLPVGLDTEFFKRKTEKLDKKFFEIVFCGKLIQLKGPDTAISILKQIHTNGHTQTRLHIIGDGPLREVLKQQVRQACLEDAVVFYGQQSQTEIKKQFEQADVFLLPGRYDANGRAETQGLVIQEAQAMALPVVVSDVGGMKYGLIDGETGFVVKEGDLEGFVTNIISLFDDFKLRESMGLSGRKFVVEQYENIEILKSLLSIYNRL